MKKLLGLLLCLPIVACHTPKSGEKEPIEDVVRRKGTLFLTAEERQEFQELNLKRQEQRMERRMEAWRKAPSDTWSPFSYSFGEVGAYHWNICGIMIQDFHHVPFAYGPRKPNSVEGWEYPCFAQRSVYGLGIGWWGSEVLDMNGIQVGLMWNRAKELNGIQVGSLFNGSEDFGGIQVAGLSNQAKYGSGLQIAGLYNEIKEHDPSGSDWSVQIGLWNRNANGWKFPLVNFKFGGNDKARIDPPVAKPEPKIEQAPPPAVKVELSDKPVPVAKPAPAAKATKPKIKRKGEVATKKTPGPEVEARIKRLDSLHEKGLLTDEEYARKKAEILGAK